MTIYRYLTVLLLLWSIAACQDDTSSRRAVGEERAVPVELWTAMPSLVEERIESVATLTAFESVALTARVSGKVSAVHFDDGQQVEAGRLLLELEVDEPAARVQEVEAALQEVRLQLDRLGSLGADISTRAAIDIARANVAAEEARLAQAKATLAEHRLRAPFAGTLGFRQVSIGALVTPGTVVAELDDISRLKLDFTLPEVYLSRLAQGDRVLAHSPAWPETTFEATVRSIGSRVDPVTRAVAVRGLLSNDDHRLRPGMLMTVELVVGESQAMVIPEKALVQKGVESYVFSIDDESRAFRLPVQVARRVEGGVVISDGLSPGQAVVTSGQLNLQPGTLVKDVGQSPVLTGGSPG